jgi:hypothetical protein
MRCARCGADIGPTCGVCPTCQPNPDTGGLMARPAASDAAPLSASVTMTSPDVSGWSALARRSVVPSSSPGMLIPVTNSRVLPVAGLATALRVLLSVDCAAGLLLAAGRFWQYRLVGQPLSGGALITRRSAHDADDLTNAAGLLLTVVVLAVAVLMICWLYRIAANAELLYDHSGGTLRWPWTKGWAIGAWFLPLLSLWVPVQLLVNAHRLVWRTRTVGGPPLPSGDPADGGGARGIGLLVSCWWTAWLANLVAGGVAVVFAADQRYDLEPSVNNQVQAWHDLRSLCVAVIVGVALQIVAALLLAAIVARVSHGQAERVAALLCRARQAASCQPCEPFTPPRADVPEATDSPAGGHPDGHPDGPSDDHGDQGGQ